MYPNVKAIAHTHARFVAVMTVIGATIRPMCQEGIGQVRKPLPIYPHVAPVLTDEEGMEVAQLLGDGTAILLEGHGATTVGNNLEQAVMNMINLEEQARMSWYAECAAGQNHRYIPDENVAEVGNVATANQLPHLKDVMAQRPSGERRVGGVYAYFSEMASQRAGFNRARTQSVSGRTVGLRDKSLSFEFRMTGVGCGFIPQILHSPGRVFDFTAGSPPALHVLRPRGVRGCRRGR